MPFAGYRDFDDCVSKNRDKGNPQAYCAEIQRRTEGRVHNSPTLHRYRVVFQDGSQEIVVAKDERLARMDALIKRRRSRKQKYDTPDTTISHAVQQG